MRETLDACFGPRASVGARWIFPTHPKRCFYKATLFVMNGAPAWGAVGFSWCVFTYIYIYVYRVPETQKMIQLRPWIGPRIAAHESLIFRREGEIEPKGSISGSLGHGKCDGSAF